MREVLNHRRLLHAHVVQLLEVLLLPDHLALVMEYCPGGDLQRYILARGGLSEVEGAVFGWILFDFASLLTPTKARWFFQQLIIAVDYLHKTVRVLLLY